MSPRNTPSKITLSAEGGKEEVREVPRPGYRSILIPERLYERVKRYFDDSDGSYVTISEVVREALRIYLKKRRGKTSP